MTCNDADLGERLLRPLRVAAVRLADVTKGQRHVLQGEITARQRRRGGETGQIEGGPDLLSSKYYVSFKKYPQNMIQPPWL